MGCPPGNCNSQGASTTAEVWSCCPYASSHPPSLVTRVVRSSDGLDSRVGQRSCGTQWASWDRPAQAVSPAAGLRDGGLPEWPAPQRTTRGHSGSSGCQRSSGTQWSIRDRQAASPAAGQRGGGPNLLMPALPVRDAVGDSPSSTDQAREAAGTTRLRQAGGLTLPGLLISRRFANFVPPSAAPLKTKFLRFHHGSTFW